MAQISVKEVPVFHRAARAHVGGAGDPLLLVHGGWGGAAMHWSRAWEALADRFFVIAPDLPGIGRIDQAPLPDLASYARWVDELLGALGVESAVCVGNSFGASVVCALAAQSPARVRGLALVNGFPMPPTPPLLRELGEYLLARRLLAAILHRTVYTPAALARAFVDPSLVPAELVATLRDPSPPQLAAFVDLYIHGGPDAPPPRDALLIWGEDDRLPGTTRRGLAKVIAALPGAQARRIARAGHCPQVEQPEAFVEVLSRFASERWKG
jgi:2-hydroxy-6-oxonona-2,4-dienedioate hydrolase